jgi:alcohol dehydrogenase class IV
MAVEAALRIPPRPEIVLGDGAVDDLPELVRRLGEDAVFVVTDRGLVDAGVAGLVAARLESAGLRSAVHDGVGANPCAADVLAGSAALRSFGRAVIVAVGGGSPIDAAKAMALHASNDRPLEALEHGVR